MLYMQRGINHTTLLRKMKEAMKNQNQNMNNRAQFQGLRTTNCNLLFSISSFSPPFPFSTPNAAFSFFCFLFRCLNKQIKAEATSRTAPATPQTRLATVSAFPMPSPPWPLAGCHHVGGEASPESMARGNATSEEEDMAGEALTLLKKERISGEECAPAGESVWKVRPCSDGRSSLEAPARTTPAKKTRAKGTAMASELWLK